MSDDRMPELPNAACREPGAASRFDHLHGPGLAVAAKEFCARCWDRPNCLAWALEHEDSGCWGGHGPTGLRKLRAEFGITYEQINLGVSGFSELWGSRR